MTPPNADVRPHRGGPARHGRRPLLRLALLVLAFAVPGVVGGAPALAASPSAKARVLKVGSHGERVRAVQRALHLHADGVFGERTRAAVARFQRRHHLHADGRVGPSTWKALGLGQATAGGAGMNGGASYGAAPGGSFGSRPLRRGSRRRYVRKLQRMLNAAGYDVDVDGVYGRGTAHAVRAFQREHDLTVDDVINPDDVAALQQAVAAGASNAPAPLAPGDRAVLGSDGLAVAPASAPPEVVAFIEAANKIAKKPYVYGGGHGKWEDTGYDCSGSMSYALHGAGLLDESLDSTGFEKFGSPGAGTWMTIYANSGHSYMIVAGLRFDTSGQSDDGSRWHDSKRPTRGYVVRHPDNL